MISLKRAVCTLVGALGTTMVIAGVEGWDRSGSTLPGYLQVGAILTGLMVVFVTLRIDWNQDKLNRAKYRSQVFVNRDWQKNPMSHGKTKLRRQ